MDRNIKFTRNVYYFFRVLILLLTFAFCLGMLDVLTSVRIFDGPPPLPTFWQSDKPYYLLITILSFVFFIPMFSFRDPKKIMMLRLARVIAPLSMALASDFIHIETALMLAMVVIIVDQFLISIASKFQFKF